LHFYQPRKIKLKRILKFMCTEPKLYKVLRLHKTMAEQKETDQSQFYFADLNTRLKDIEERNRLIRERVLLLGKNLVSSKQSLSEELKEIKRENLEIKNEMRKLTVVSKNLLTEFEKFVKRDEMSIIERMLKDFKPLEFMRRKDVEDLINQRISGQVDSKQIKTNISSK